MTSGPPQASDDAVRQWCGDATEVLRDAAVRAGRLAAAVATDWLDDHGREWSERITTLRRELADTAYQADALVRRLRESDGSDSQLGSAMAAALRAVSSASRGGDGPRLGDTSGARVDDEHGVHIAQLPDASPY
jgi:hypothetical protein